MIYIELNCTVQVRLNKEKRKNWGKANYNQMLADITSISWPEALIPFNTDNVPLIKQTNRNQPVWMNRELLRLVRRKRRKWKLYKQTGRIQHYEDYRTLEQSVKKSVKTQRKTMRRGLQRTIRTITELSITT